MLCMCTQHQHVFFVFFQIFHPEFPTLRDLTKTSDLAEVLRCLRVWWIATLCQNNTWQTWLWHKSRKLAWQAKVNISEVSPPLCSWYGCIVLTVRAAALRKRTSVLHSIFLKLYKHNGNNNSRFLIIRPALQRLTFQRMENCILSHRAQAAAMHLLCTKEVTLLLLLI